MIHCTLKTRKVDAFVSTLGLMIQDTLKTWKVDTFVWTLGLMIHYTLKPEKWVLLCENEEVSFAWDSNAQARNIKMVIHQSI